MSASVTGESTVANSIGSTSASAASAAAAAAAIRAISASSLTSRSVLTTEADRAQGQLGGERRSTPTGVVVAGSRPTDRASASAATSRSCSRTRFASAITVAPVAARLGHRPIAVPAVGAEDQVVGGHDRPAVRTGEPGEPAHVDEVEVQERVVGLIRSSAARDCTASTRPR